MKATKFFMAIMVAGISLMSFSSCLKGDSNNEDPSKPYRYTDADKTLIMTTACGNYSGKVYFFNMATGSAVDSASVGLTLSVDSTLTIEKFPVSKLAFYVTSDPDKEAVKQIPDSPLKATTSIPALTLDSYFNGGLYEFDVTTDPSAFKAIIVGEKNISVYFSKSAGSFYSYCQYYKNKMQGYYIIDEIVVNSNRYVVRAPVRFLVSKF